MNRFYFVFLTSIEPKRVPKVSWFRLTKKLIIMPNSGIMANFQLMLANYRFLSRSLLRRNKLVGTELSDYFSKLAFIPPWIKFFLRLKPVFFIYRGIKTASNLSIVNH